MNKYQKALMETESLYINKYNNGKIDEDKFNEIIKPLQELVDRATPKKPIVEISNNVRHVDCSTCGDGYAHIYHGKNDFNNNNYCSNCGQALDWENTDESQPNELDNMFADSLATLKKLVVK